MMMMMMIMLPCFYLCCGVYIYADADTAYTAAVYVYAAADTYADVLFMLLFMP